MSKKSRPQQKPALPQEDKKEVKTLTTPSEFSFTITKIAVSQICQSLGFQAIQVSALETLTSVATKYLQSIAKSAASFATISNRTHSNLFDLINALHDAQSARGFEGASNAHQKCLLSSGAVLELIKFVQTSDEIPFAKPIPRNNLSTNSISSQKLGALVGCNELNSRGSHIPKWLPAFPDAHLYEKCDERFCEKRVSDERFWENRVSERNCGSAKCDSKGQKSGNLGARRGIVRFKIGVVGGREEGMGVDMRNGVCRGGKRVCWSNRNNDRIDEEDEKLSGFKRRR